MFSVPARSREQGDVVVAEPTSEVEEQALRAARGDRDAVAALYDRHAPDVRRLLGALGLRGAAVDDGVQETFLRLLADLRRGARRYDPTRALRPYVLGIARHVAVDVARRASRRPAEPLDGRALADGGAAPPQDAARREARELVHDAMAALEPDLAHALTLRHVAGLSMEELAEALGCSVPTARARLVAGAARMTGELRRRGLAPGAPRGEERTP